MLAKYIELDFPEITLKKAISIKKRTELFAPLGDAVFNGECLAPIMPCHTDDLFKVDRVDKLDKVDEALASIPAYTISSLATFVGQKSRSLN